MIQIYSDRSTVLRHRECARRRWYESEVPTPGGFGVSPKAQDPNLLVGTVFHEGVRGLLEGLGIEEAYGRAQQLHLKLLPHLTQPIPQESGASEYLRGESLALGEALIRGYEKVVLPQVLDRFEVLSVEQEEITPLSIPALPHLEVLFGGRTDGILRERAGGDLFVLSLKTKKEWKPGDEDKNRYDTQGLTEWLAVESRLGRWQAVLERDQDMPGNFQAHQDFISPDNGERIPWWFVKCFIDQAPPSLMGVTMQFALKGGQWKDKDGIKKHTSPLIRPWVKAGPSRREWAWKYEWEDALGGGHRLGKGWTRTNIWESWSVKEWIDYLWEENVQELGPGLALEQSFILPMDYYRNAEDRERRVRQIVWQEAGVQESRDRLVQIQKGGGGLAAIEEELDRSFPMHSDYPNNCGYCPYEICCFGPKQYLVDPLASGSFAPRVSNHPIEVEIRGKGKARD